MVIKTYVRTLLFFFVWKKSVNEQLHVNATFQIMSSKSVAQLIHFFHFYAIYLCVVCFHGIFDKLYKVDKR